MSFELLLISICLTVQAVNESSDSQPQLDIRISQESFKNPGVWTILPDQFHSALEGGTRASEVFKAPPVRLVFSEGCELLMQPTPQDFFKQLPQVILRQMTCKSFWKTLLNSHSLTTLSTNLEVSTECLLCLWAQEKSRNGCMLYALQLLLIPSDHIVLYNENTSIPQSHLNFRARL